MSIQNVIPLNPNAVRVRYPVMRFSAPFVAGQYDFAQAGNTNQSLLKMQANSIYLIERISFFAQCGESDWLLGMDTVANFPAFFLRYKYDDAHSLFPEPVRCANFKQNEEQSVYFWSTRENEELLISFTGIVNQVAGMVGIDPLLVEVNFTLYQIINEKWNRGFVNPNHFGG